MHGSIVKLNIKELAKGNNYSVTQLSKDLGVSRTTLFNYNNKPETIPLGIIIRMSKILNVSVFDVIGIGGTIKGDKQGANSKLLSQLNEIKKILLEEVGNNHKTIIALVKSRAEDIGADLTRELSQSHDLIKGLLDLQDKVSDERMAAVKNREVPSAERADEDKLVEDIIKIDERILGLHTQLMSLV